MPSWFVRVEDIKDRLLANNAATYWVPAYVKEKRFHNWLENARDWVRPGGGGRGGGGGVAGEAGKPGGRRQSALGAWRF